MFKWIIIMVVLYWWIWYILSVNSTYKPISDQIDVKTMSLRKPSYIINTRSVCSWICQNFSSSSSWWWWWGWWK